MSRFVLMFVLLIAGAIVGTFGLWLVARGVDVLPAVAVGVSVFLGWLAGVLASKGDAT